MHAFNCTEMARSLLLALPAQIERAAVYVYHKGPPRTLDAPAMVAAHG